MKEDRMQKQEIENVKPKIMFLCNFSNPMIREKLVLSNNVFRSLYYRQIKKASYSQTDYAIWVSDYIDQFEKHNEIEFHVVAPIQGLKGTCQSFEEKGIFYHFYNCSYNIIKSIANTLINFEEKRNYLTIRKRIANIRKRIKPDLVLLCGAENPYYSIGVLDVKECPIYVILQTLLNNPKRIEMGVGSPYKRHIELEIFKYARYFCSCDPEEVEAIKQQNKQAIILPASFPTHRPSVIVPEKKEYDFVFFAKTIGKYKGIEDAIKALSIVKQKYPTVKLKVIGGISESYLETLRGIVNNYKIYSNVIFAGLYQELKETFENVAKAKAVVVPGITGMLNSTVRESMLIGLPTICYETRDTGIINQEEQCLLTAPMEDVEALARQMLFVLDEPEKAQMIAKTGKTYAEKHYSNEAIVNCLLDNCQKILNSNTL